jgi:glycosyltransferase involved in cell wall biosynthesis
MLNPGGQPLVTVGVPTFNSGLFVRESLESLASQDYRNLQIIVSDDGSTDDTAAICAEFAARDPRFRLSRGPHLGERHNFNSLLALAQGEYFMWAADHDLRDARYISACVAALESDREAVLAYSRTMLIDKDGNELGPMDDVLVITQHRPLDRYRRIIWHLEWCNAIYGVMRRDAIARTGGYGPTPGPDHLVLAKMAIQGTFIQLDEPLFYRRQNRPPETFEEMRIRQSYDLEPGRAQVWLKMSRGRYYRTLRDGHLRAVLGAPWSVRDRLLGVSATLACFADRFAVMSRPLRIARRSARMLPASLRSRLAGAATESRPT